MNNMNLDVLKFLVMSSPFEILLLPLLYKSKLFLETELATEEDKLATSFMSNLSLFSVLLFFLSV